MGLEDVLNKFNNAIDKPIHFAGDLLFSNPWAFSALSAVAAYLQTSVHTSKIQGHEVSYLGAPNLEVVAAAAPVGYLVARFMYAFIKDMYPFLPKVRKKPKLRDLAKAASEFVIENPLASALVIGSALAAPVLYYNKIFSEQTIIESWKPEKAILIEASSAAFVDMYLRILRARKRTRKSKKDKSTGLPSSLKILKARLSLSHEEELRLRHELKLPEGITKAKNQLRIGNLYLKQQETEQAYQAYKRAFKSLAGEVYYNAFELLATGFSGSVLPRLGDYFFIANRFNTALKLLANGNSVNARAFLIDELKETKDEEEIARINYMILCVSRNIGKKSLIEQDAKSLIESIPQASLKQIGNSKSLVVAGAGSYWDRELVIKYGDYGALQREYALTMEIAKVVFDSADERFLTPRPLAVVSVNPSEKTKGASAAYIMDHELGETLAEKLRYNPDGAKKSLDGIADFLALIHARIPIDIIQEKREHSADIAKRIFSLPIPSELKARINNSIMPFIESLESCVLVYDKDAHADNWMITPEKKIIVLDCENRVINQRERDIANLTDTWGFFTEEEKRYILSRINQDYTAYTGIKIDEAQSRYSYLNAVVVKAVEDISPLYERRDFQRATAVLKNAQQSIGTLRAEFQDKLEKEKVDAMYISLSELEAHLQQDAV